MDKNRKQHITESQCYAYIYRQYVMGVDTPSVRAHCDLVYGIYDDVFDELLERVQVELCDVGKLNRDEARGEAILRTVQVCLLAYRSGDTKSAELAYTELEKLLGVQLPYEVVDENAARLRIEREKVEGWVYCIHAMTTPHFKIGKARDAIQRTGEIAVSSSLEIEQIAHIRTTNRHKLEKWLHKKYADKRVKGEWFALAPDDIEYIKALARERNSGELFQPGISIWRSHPNSDSSSTIT